VRGGGLGWNDYVAAPPLPPSHGSHFHDSYDRDRERDRERDRGERGGHIMIMLLHLLLGGMIALQVFLCRLFTKELLRVFSLLDLLQCRIFQLIVVEPVLSQFLQSRQLINQQVFFR
jgi:hypothetical protein